MAEVKHRLKHALRSVMSNDLDKPDQVTSLTFLIRALRADLGQEEPLFIGWRHGYTGGQCNASTKGVVP